jgi:hypothetical protein
MYYIDNKALVCIDTLGITTPVQFMLVDLKTMAQPNILNLTKPSRKSTRKPSKRKVRSLNFDGIVSVSQDLTHLLSSVIFAKKKPLKTKKRI